MQLTKAPEQKLPLPADAIPGALLVAVAILAMILVNSPAGPGFKALLDTSFVIGPANSPIDMKISSWIKNALMAVFFFFVGLELKRELLEGQLSQPKAAALPVLAAVGGMVVPAGIYLILAGDAGFANGWAIPAATDIAFALGVLSLLGNRVPPALKAFLLAVAVVDDLGAILIVAVFYTEGLLLGPLGLAALATIALLVMGGLRVRSIGLYVLGGIVLWVFLQQSGISPTLAGVLAAAAVPMRDRHDRSPLHEAEHDLRPWVMFGVMPVFALANAGVPLAGAGEYLTHPVTLGIAFGLALGKPIGILAFALLGIVILKSRLPGTIQQVLGVGCIAGIGFTMSLFIGALALVDPALATPVRLGVYAGSILAAVTGLAILTASLPKASEFPPEGEDPTAPFIKAEAVFAARDRDH